MFTSVDYHIVILLSLQLSPYSYFFFFNDTATTEIYTLSLHDALPISFGQLVHAVEQEDGNEEGGAGLVLRQVIFGGEALDRKSTRLNSSHSQISYAVFCLKKKKKAKKTRSSVIICNVLITSDSDGSYD